MSFLALIGAIVGGFAYWSPAARPFWRSWNVSSLGLSVPHRAAAAGTIPLATTEARGLDHEAPRPVDSGLEPPAADPSRELAVQTPGIDRASVLIFTARPGSIVTAGSTGGLLCRQRHRAGQHRTCCRQRLADEHVDVSARVAITHDHLRAHRVRPRWRRRHEATCDRRQVSEEFVSTTRRRARPQRPPLFVFDGASTSQRAAATRPPASSRGRSMCP